MPTIVAVPSNAPGGLDAGLSDHFGHCDAFTIVAIEDNRVSDVKVLPNEGHEHGGCLAPVQLLAANGAKVLIAGGMGQRPLAGFRNAGIMVLQWGDARTVGQAVEAMARGQLAHFGADHTCGGGGHRH
ncbi:MAG: NifB/NifX family molybdenum-iron cluster-binding protein [Rhodospirillales bacterium]|nr:NifB/NifX family molybdenum-iron cluster-binding protein [Rhodospirillales bacterium]